MFDFDASVLPSDYVTLLAPTLLNFLYQSRGILAVLPSREAPHRFRETFLSWVSRRLFDSRVRIVDYAGEDDESPYVVSLAHKEKNEAMQRMVSAERAVQGAHKRPFIELNAIEVLETVVGAEQAAKMYFFGMKRTRDVGNLGVALLRPGLKVADAARSLMDYEFTVRRTDLGLLLTGLRPSFSAHLVVEDRQRGPPAIELIPSP